MNSPHTENFSPKRIRDGILRLSRLAYGHLHGEPLTEGPIKVVISTGKRADQIVYTSKHSEPDGEQAGSGPPISTETALLLLRHFLCPVELSILRELSDGEKKGTTLDNRLDIDRNHRLEVCKQLKSRGLLESSGEGYKLAGAWVIDLLNLVSGDR